MENIPYYCERIFPFQAVLGIGGNIINLMVLFSRPMRSRTNILLACAAISDIVFLLALVPHNIARFPTFVYTHCGNDTTKVPRCYTGFTRFYINYKQNFTFLANMFSASSSWFLVAVSFDRLWAIKSPFSARGMKCSMRQFTVVPVIFITSAVFTFHHNYNFKTVSTTEGSSRLLSTNSERWSIIMTLLNVTYQTFLPVFLLIGLNVFLIYYLRNRRQFFEAAAPLRDSSRRSTKSEETPPLLHPRHAGGAHGTVRETLSGEGTSHWSRSASAAERHVTWCVAAIVTFYIITHIPSTIVFANMYIFHLEHLYRHKHTYVWVALSTAIVVSGKVANFFLFCFSSKHYRSQLCKQLRRIGRWRRRGEPPSAKGSEMYRTRSIQMNQIGDRDSYNNNNTTTTTNNNNNMLGC